MPRHRVMQGLALAVVVAVLAAASAPVAAADAEGFDEQFLRARDLALQGQRAAAIAAYDRLLETHPGNPDALLGRGRVHAWMGAWTAAEADLGAATAAAPGYADAWSALGDLYLWSDRPRNAVQAYDRWVELAPDEAAPRIARARAQRGAGRLAEARADIEAAARLGADAALVRDFLASLAPPPGDVGVRPPDAVGEGPYRWTASLGVDVTDFPSAGFHWVDSVAAIRRKFDGGSLGFETLESSRFGRWDTAWALDGYVNLWSRAYANLRFQDGPGAVLFPRTRWRAELFQGVGTGWELSASYDRLDYSAPVELLGVGVARYLGNWYLRWLHLYVPSTPSSPSWSNSDRIVVRNYFKGDADNYVEVAAGLGSSVEPTGFVVGPGQATHSWSASTALVRFPTPRFGFKLGVDVGYGVELEPHGSVGAFSTLYYRW